MSHVVCDICGTSYAPSENVCPLCGKKRDAADVLVTEDEVKATEGAEERNARPRTKGGHFSPKNVERANREREEAAAVGAQHMFRKPPEERPTFPDEVEIEEDEPENGGRGRRAAVIILVIAVLMVGAYVLTRFILGRSDPIPESTLPSASSTQPETKPCTSIGLDSSGIKLTSVGETYLLRATVQPGDTTDTVVFSSADEKVATVTQDGIVTCVGGGETKILVTCGEVTVECRVTCSIPETEPETEPTEETEPETEPTEETEPETKPTDPANEYTINNPDMTLFYKGEQTYLWVSGVTTSSITWRSDNNAIATVTGDGQVTAVGPGTTTIRATLPNGKVLTSIVRCSFKEEATEPTETEPTKPTDPEQPSVDPVSYGLSSTDVTIAVDESFTLSLTDEKGNTPSGITWSVANSAVCTVSGSGRVTGLASGTTQVTATVDGKSYSCIVRVK